MTAKKKLRITRLSLDGTHVIELTQPAGRPLQVRIVTRKCKPGWSSIHPSTVERLRELLGAVGK